MGKRRALRSNKAVPFIHRYVPGASGRTLLLLHGTGGSEDDLLPLGRNLDPQAGLLSPRGQVLENGMPRFFRRLAEGVFDREDLIRRTDELAGFIEASAREHGFDAGNVVAIGYSNGANIAGGLLLLRPGILRAAALLRPMVPLIPEKLPDLLGVPVLVSSGSHDPIVPPANARELVALLRKAGAEVTVESEPGGHSLTEQSIESVRRWLGKLGPA